jgi:hypothetical protein
MKARITAKGTMPMNIFWKMYRKWRRGYRIFRLKVIFTRVKKTVKYWRVKGMLGCASCVMWEANRRQITNRSSLLLNVVIYSVKELKDNI